MVPVFFSRDARISHTVRRKYNPSVPTFPSKKKKKERKNPGIQHQRLKFGPPHEPILSAIPTFVTFPLGMSHSASLFTIYIFFPNLKS